MTDGPELDSWLSFFRARRNRSVDLPWSEDVPLSEAERDLIARSIATFQLGESSDGAHLLATARRFGTAHDLPALAEITQLFIREEQFHAALLAAFMKKRGIALLSAQWSDRIFRSFRHLGGFEVAISVLLVAEILLIQLRSRRSPVVRRCARGLHRFLYAGALVVVYSGHRGVLRAGGYEPRLFWDTAWSRFGEYLGPTG